MNQPLAETIFWIAALACAVAEIALLRSILAQRRTQTESSVPLASPITELIWAIIPAIILAFLLISTWRRIEARENHMQTHHGQQQVSALSRLRLVQ